MKKKMFFVLVLAMCFSFVLSGAAYGAELNNASERDIINAKTIGSEVVLGPSQPYRVDCTYTADEINKIEDISLAEQLATQIAANPDKNLLCVSSSIIFVNDQYDANGEIIDSRWLTNYEVAYMGLVLSQDDYTVSPMSGNLPNPVPQASYYQLTLSMNVWENTFLGGHYEVTCDAIWGSSGSGGDQGNPNKTSEDSLAVSWGQGGGSNESLDCVTRSINGQYKDGSSITFVSRAANNVKGYVWGFDDAKPSGLLGLGKTDADKIHAFVVLHRNNLKFTTAVVVTYFHTWQKFERSYTFNTGGSGVTMTPADKSWPLEISCTLPAYPYFK